MPELPDITVYVERLSKLVAGHELQRVRIASPFLLRTVDPPISAVNGKRVKDFRRLGKRIVFVLEDDLFLVLHLMVAGRLQWKTDTGAKVPGKVGLAAFDFDNGTLTLTEASQKKRASLSVVRGEAALDAHDPGGIEPLTMTLAQFKEALVAEKHTLKRTLTDPRTYSGIGNAYSDEILHRARLSPVRMSTALEDDEVQRLYRAIQDVLVEWTDRLRADDADKPLPEKVTAFRKEMAVHGKAGEPCPVCGSPVQRIAYADNETNYCATCQTGGKLLADRALSTLMKKDWPKTLDELEALKKAHRDT
jgi:formamidopyrimidine-DNA glycosylase